MKGKILVSNSEKPVIPSEEFGVVRSKIFTRPRGSVFVIPPDIYPVFEGFLYREITSDIEIYENVSCIECKYTDNFRECPIFKPEYIISWNKEVCKTIPGVKEAIAPFWIIPRQSWWLKVTYAQHVPSNFFYSFKSGYQLYSKLFAEGITLVIERDPRFNKIKFDYITNIPLSPDKRSAGELDRVDVLCSKLKSLLGTRYAKNMLILRKPISRRAYKFSGKSVTEFTKDYHDFLRWRRGPRLDDKDLLVVDDVITDGRTLMAFARKVHEKYPRARIYAAACGIMAKKGNMTPSTIRKYEL